MASSARSIEQNLTDMTQEEAKQRIARLVAALDQLRPSQIGWIEAVVAQLQRAMAFSRSEKSDLVTPCVLDDFGDALRIHHCFSAEPFSKDKFEYALEEQNRDIHEVADFLQFGAAITDFRGPPPLPRCGHDLRTQRSGRSDDAGLLPLRVALCASRVAVRN